MRAPEPRSFLQRHFAWLLWLVLLVPVAQGAAAMHALSHAPDELAGSRDGKALHAAQCDLCLAAAAVTSGALPGVPTTLPLLELRHAAPPRPAIELVAVAPPRRYLTRAPPFATH